MEFATIIAYGIWEESKGNKALRLNEPIATLRFNAIRFESILCDAVCSKSLPVHVWRLRGGGVAEETTIIPYEYTNGIEAWLTIP